MNENNTLKQPSFTGDLSFKPAQDEQRKEAEYTPPICPPQKRKPIPAPSKDLEACSESEQHHDEPYVLEPRSSLLLSSSSSILDRFIALWTLLAMVVDIHLGNLVPNTIRDLETGNRRGCCADG